MYITIKMSGLFGFAYDLEEIIYGLGFELIIKRNNYDRALQSTDAGAGAVASIRCIIECSCYRS